MRLIQLLDDSGNPRAGVVDGGSTGAARRSDDEQARGQQSESEFRGRCLPVHQSLRPRCPAVRGTVPT